MNRVIKRKHFLSLTIGATALGLAAACGDDGETSGDNEGGSGGSGGSSGGNGGASNGGTSNGGTSTSGTSNGGSVSVSGSGGTSPTNAGAAPGGAGGTAELGSGGEGGVPMGEQGGQGGTPGGQGGAGAGGLGGAGAGGMGGSDLGGQGGMGGQTNATGCASATLTHPAAGHDHIPTPPTTLFADLTAHIESGEATMAFTLPTDFNHTHTITLTPAQVAVLRSGGTVTGVVSSPGGNTSHTHTYTVSCG